MFMGDRIMDKTIIGKRLRRQREYLSLTREQFAEKVELSPQFVAQLENATRGMSAETLYKICERTNISADYLLLGRQLINGERTPAVELLSKIPPQFSEMTEEILRNLLAAIERASTPSE